MDYIFQMQVIGGHWFVAAFRMITTGLEGESVGGMFGLYGVCCIAGRLDHKRSVDVFIFVVRVYFESVYLGDGSRLAVMLSDFLLIWSCL